MRPVTLLGAVAATLLSLLVVPAPPANAATTYTWSGAENNAWGNKKNWNPEGVPKDGDAVELGPGPRPTITDVPDVTLTSLSVTGSPDGLVSMSGRGQVITGSLRWNGGGKPARWVGGAARFDQRDRGQLHVCQKPLALMEALIRDFSDRGETVLDPFAGSATTLVAAKRLGRHGLGWEIDSASHAVAGRRLDATHEQLELDARPAEAEQLELRR